MKRKYYLSVDDKKDIEESLKEAHRLIKNINKHYGLGVSIAYYNFKHDKIDNDEVVCIFLHDYEQDAIMEINSMSQIEGCLDREDAWSSNIQNREDLKK